MFFKINSFSTLKEKKIEETLSRFFIFIIIFGLIKNLIDFRYYEQWAINEWLISYAGGLVRRGLSGEIIYKISLLTDLSPINIIHFISILSFITFLILLKECRKYFSTLFLLSPLISLFPILTGSVMRKDIFGIVIFAIILKFISSKNKLNSFLIINLMSSISILIHESYFFYAMPGLILLHIYLTKNNGMFNVIYNAFIRFLPTIFTMIICILFKGDNNTAQLIHNSWQEISHLIPSIHQINGLYGSEPVMAIEAIGWDFKKGLSLSISTLYEFKYKIIWSPLFWLFMIFLSSKIFIGDKRNTNSRIKIIVLIFQLSSISPLFILGWDFGRWIFLWLASSVFLTKEFIKLEEERKLSSKNFFRFFPEKVQYLFRGYQLQGFKKYYYLLISIPVCCWNFSEYIKITPLIYLIKTPLKIYLSKSGLEI